jgi:uroporphyrinogen-III synthase
MLTSGQAALRAGPPLYLYEQLPCYCVGDATASAARKAGLDRIVTGPSDGTALLDLMATAGVGRALHLCGRDHLELDDPAVRVTRRAVYAAEAVSELPDRAGEALRAGALALIHSPRAGQLFAALVNVAGLERHHIAVAAISPAAAAALGYGWRHVVAAPAPSDHALLELAAKLCQNGGKSGPGL